MKKNSLKSLLKANKTAVNGWLSIPSSYSAEVMAHCGFDAITVDLQHGMIDFGQAVTMLQALPTNAAWPRVFFAPMERWLGDAPIKVSRWLLRATMWEF